MRRKSINTSGRPKGKSGWIVENFAERVFVTCPRSFSFSHRGLISLRHPYLAVLVDFVDSRLRRDQNRVEELLGSLVDLGDEERKWSRVGAMFDLKLKAEEIDLLRRKVFLHPQTIVCIEAMWSALGGVENGLIKEEEYKTFHYKLYSYLLRIDSVSVVTSTNTAITEDFMYDRRGSTGVTFGAFALSLLELADNWTKSRDPEDYVSFLKELKEKCFPGQQTQPPRKEFQLSFSRPVYFSGGIICQEKSDDRVEYVKVKF